MPKNYLSGEAVSVLVETSRMLAAKTIEVCNGEPTEEAARTLGESMVRIGLAWLGTAETFTDDEIANNGKTAALKAADTVRGIVREAEELAIGIIGRDGEGVG